MTKLDHLVWAVPDLQAAVERVQEEWGCTVYPGGRHPAWGSHNALVPLRSGSYLEIIAPHEEPPAQGPRVFGLDALVGGGEPALQTWALRSQDTRDPDPLARLSRSALTQGVDLGGTLQGSREAPDGTLLEWSLTDPFADRLGGVVPFLIHWGHTPHPAQVGAPQVEVLHLEVGHPMAVDVERALMGLECGEMVAVTAENDVFLRATLRTPAGEVRLTGPRG